MNCPSFIENHGQHLPVTFHCHASFIVMTEALPIAGVIVRDKTLTGSFSNI